MKDQVLGRWQNISDQMAAKPMREKLIVALLVFALIWAFFNFILLMPIENKNKKLTKRLDAAKAEITKLSATETVLAKALANDPNAKKKRDIMQLEKKKDELDLGLEKLSVGLIPADKLPIALHDVLEPMGALKLLGMKTHEPTKLNFKEGSLAANESGGEKDLSDENAPLVVQPEEQVGVYKHAVMVAVEGRYFDVIKYLDALEQLPWTFYWESIDYQVKDYPIAKVYIEVYTLSTDKGMLGV